MLKNMNYVYAVYLHKSFSKAATELHISQPALSVTIKRVEDYIGLTIFDRSTNPIQLTQAGEYYIESIKNIRNLEKEMTLYFNRLIENNNNVINIGAASFFCTYFLPSIIQKFKVEHPDYTINLLEANADDLIKFLHSDVVDIIIDVEKRSISNALQSIVLEKEHILLVVPTSYKINNHLEKYHLNFCDVTSGKHLNKNYPKVNLKEFEYKNFLLLKEGNDIHERSMKMCKQAGFTPNVTMHLDQMLTSYKNACNKKGIAFVRAGVARYLEPTEKVRFYKIDDKHAYQNINLYYKKSNPLSKVDKDFITFLQSKKHDSLNK